jgi:hypothetical protein
MTMKYHDPATFFGVICGASVMILVALWITAKPKVKIKPQTGVATASVSVTGNSGESMDVAHARMLENVLRGATDHKLWEITFPTRH